MQSPPQPFSSLSQISATFPFQHVAVKGKYVNQLTMFVQNKFFKNQPGFEVLTPIQLAGEKKLLLIDRGWISKQQNNVLPKIQEVTSEQAISGYIKVLKEYQFILGKNILEPTHSPLVMQKIDLDEISRITRQEYYPFILKLDPASPNGFVREWIITTVEPQRHVGYAIQWFLMALILLIAYFSFCRERSNDEK